MVIAIGFAIMNSTDTPIEDLPVRTSVEQVLACLEDISCTQRFRDFVINPQELPADLRSGYVVRFSEPYLDPDAFASKNLPDFMISSMERLFVSLMDYGYTKRDDRVMPQITCWDLSPHAYAELRHHGVRVFTSKWQADLEDECMVIQCKHGLIFAPFETVEFWADEIALSNASAAALPEEA